MVNVTHNDDDGRTTDKLVGAVLVIVDKPLLNGNDDLLLDLAAKLHCNERCGVVIHNVGN